VKYLRSLFTIFGLMVTISTVGGCGCELTPLCVTEPASTFLPGEGIPWTFNVTNQSGGTITVKVMPLRNQEYREDTQDLNRNPPTIVDGPIVEKKIAQGVSESMVVRTGKSFGGSFDDPRVFRSFKFEITGLNTVAITSFGWPIEGAHNTTVQYYGLGYMYNPGFYAYVSPHQLLSSLASGHYLCSDPIYNVTIENSNSIKWSLDEKVKLDCDPAAPTSP